MKVKCKFCGYVWSYKGKLITATCPSCLNKVRIKFLAGKDMHAEGGVHPSPSADINGVF